MISRGARFLRDARRKAGLSQRALAARAGVPQPTIAAIETGRQKPRYATLERLLRTCGYELDIAPVLGQGVDRTLIHQMLDLTPAERASWRAGGARARASPSRRAARVTTATQFDPLGQLGVLARHGVRFVLIGGFAGKLWGSPTVTTDIDVCYARDNENLEALAGALRELGATLRGGPTDLPFRLDSGTIPAGDHLTLTTRLGELDCLGTPQGASGFAELDRNAAAFDLEGLTVRVASLDDLIRMKRSAGRPKDRIEVEVLGALREEIERRGER